MENRRGILLMIAAMAAFSVEDAFIKRAALSASPGQIIMLLGLAGAPAFWALARRRKERIVTRELLAAPSLVRLGGDVLATLCFVTALALVPLATASAILQAVPLAITAGAALVLGETVGWRRWSAVTLGFVGVLMIVRPGLDGFAPASLFAVSAVAGLAVRDLATRFVTRRTTSLQLSTWAFAAMAPTGAILMALTGGWRPLDTTSSLALAAALAFGLGAYWLITEAVRAGELSVVAPFRYSRLIFALAIAVAFFGERPDVWTLCGAAVIIATGLYTLSRERSPRRAAPTAASPIRTDIPT